MDPTEDTIADLVIAKFDALPVKSKPVVDAYGVSGWVPLSGIVFTNGDGSNAICVALATGMKCLPSIKIPQAHGFVLHDWHAEVLAIRGLNHFLIQECHDLAQSPKSHSPFVRWRDTSELSAYRGLQPFTIRESWKMHMYCSEAPCGDASMELTMDAQPDATPWRHEIIVEEREKLGTTLKGRGFFSELGIVRRKPSRPDSPPTLSKSCSDKLALKQCTSLLSSPASLLICPENAYLNTLILPDSEFVASACDRSFGPAGRMGPVANKIWSGGYSYRPFKTSTTRRNFEHSRRRPDHQGVSPKPSNIAALWTLRQQETLINGVLQGRKQTDVKGASAVCRLKTSKLVMDTLALLAFPFLMDGLKSLSYMDLKRVKMLEDRSKVKQAVKDAALAKQPSFPDHQRPFAPSPSSATTHLFAMADKLRTQQQLEQLQARYVGTGHADTTKFEWTSNIHRDSYASYVGHPPLLEYMAIGMGEPKEKVRAMMIEKMIQPVGKPPEVQD
ncbi:hypothetical protein MMC11_001400 [Xylographa trunciseda]|nr:hypothetical protein [Xylographa trunciseda]